MTCTLFMKTGKIKKYKITTDMIGKLTQTDPASYDITKSLTLKLPAAAIGKYIMLVIAGHLGFKETFVFSQYTADTLLLNLNVDNAMIDRYYCANSILDLSAVNAIVNPTNQKYIDQANLLTESSLKAILTMSQSFIVAFDNPEMYFATSEAMRTVSRVQYQCNTKPNVPILGLQGYCPEYWSTDEKKGYSIRLSSPRKYIISDNTYDPMTGTYADQIDVTQTKVDYDSYLFRQDRKYLSLLEMGSDMVS